MDGHVIHIYGEVSAHNLHLEKGDEIMAWKVAGKLVRPKNITVGSNSPSLVVKATFHSCPFFILTTL
jgi:hypothetical protein